MDEKVKAVKKTADEALEIIETHSHARLDPDDFGRCVLRSVRDAVFFEATGLPVRVACQTSGRLLNFTLLPHTVANRSHAMS